MRHDAAIDEDVPRRILTAATVDGRIVGVAGSVPQIDDQTVVFRGHDVDDQIFGHDLH